MSPRRKKEAPVQAAEDTEFKVNFTKAAEADLASISDQGTVEVILRRSLELRLEPMKQGKPLQGELKNYRSVRAAGQRYRIVYEVAVLEA
jgi:mRNA interferase RelE/StbE